MGPRSCLFRKTVSRFGTHVVPDKLTLLSEGEKCSDTSYTVFNAEDRDIKEVDLRSYMPVMVGSTLTQLVSSFSGLAGLHVRPVRASKGHMAMTLSNSSEIKEYLTRAKSAFQAVQILVDKLGHVYKNDTY